MVDGVDNRFHVRISRNQNSDGIRDQIDGLKKAIKDASGEKEIYKLAHSLKGTCLTLYFESLEEKVSQMENLHPNYDSPEAMALLKEIDKRYQKVEQILAEKQYLTW